MNLKRLILSNNLENEPVKTSLQRSYIIAFVLRASVFVALKAKQKQSHTQSQMPLSSGSIRNQKLQAATYVGLPHSISKSFTLRQRISTNITEILFDEATP